MLSCLNSYDHLNLSGSPKVWLQDGCHGKVLVCDSDSCGVCGDTWTDKQSEMLCKKLGCGRLIKETYRGTTKPGGLTMVSVYCSQTAEDFSQCNFAELQNPFLCQMPAYISCTGSDSIHKKYKIYSKYINGYYYP